MSVARVTRQPPRAQVPVDGDVGTGQTLLHAPQLAGSLEGSTQTPLHSVWGRPASVGGQEPPSGAASAEGPASPASGATGASGATAASPASPASFASRGKNASPPASPAASTETSAGAS